MTETPSVPPVEGEGHHHYLSGHAGRGDADQVNERITISLEESVDYEYVVRALREHLEELGASLRVVIGSGKSVRIEKLKLTAKHEKLKSAVLKNKKLRIDRERSIASRKAQIAELKDAASSNITLEEERLRRRISELESDIDDFGETLMMHRGDRDRVFHDLCSAHSRLQDILTQKILWKIILLEKDDEKAEGRRGLAGFTAELLGRLLVLEKEESQVEGLLTRGKKLES